MPFGYGAGQHVDDQGSGVEFVEVLEGEAKRAPDLSCEDGGENLDLLALLARHFPKARLRLLPALLCLFVVAVQGVCAGQRDVGRGEIGLAGNGLGKGRERIGLACRKPGHPGGVAKVRPGTRRSGGLGSQWMNGRVGHVATVRRGPDRSLTSG